MSKMSTKFAIVIAAGIIGAVTATTIIGTSIKPFNFAAAQFESPFQQPTITTPAHSTHPTRTLLSTQDIRNSISIDPNGSGGGVTARCPPGWLATGGGFAGSGSAGVFVTSSQPNPPDGWAAAAINTSPDKQVLNVIVVCAHVP